MRYQKPKSNAILFFLNGIFIENTFYAPSQMFRSIFLSAARLKMTSTPEKIMAGRKRKDKKIKNLYFSKLFCEKTPN